MISISQYLLAVSAGRAMLSHELDASQFVRHARRASFKDPRPERASRVDLPVPSRYLSPALRPHKSFSCNTYKKPGEGAVGNVFPHHGAFNTASIFRTLFQVPHPASPLLAALTRSEERRVGKE